MLRMQLEYIYQYGPIAMFHQILGVKLRDAALTAEKELAQKLLAVQVAQNVKDAQEVSQNRSFGNHLRFTINSDIIYPAQLYKQNTDSLLLRIAIDL